MPGLSHIGKGAFACCIGDFYWNYSENQNPLTIEEGAFVYTYHDPPAEGDAICWVMCPVLRERHGRGLREETDAFMWMTC